MAAATAETFASPRRDTHHRFGVMSIAFCARIVETIRGRHARQQMLWAVQELRHPGVLADMETARNPSWR
jgi:hypothetical protein